MSKEREYIGFPPKLLGSRPERLKILHQGEGVIAVEKPQGVLVDAHPWCPGVLTIVDGIEGQLVKGKQEFVDLGIEQARAIYFMEPSVTGVALMGVTAEGTEFARNTFGSQKMTFRFTFLTRSDEGDEERECDLPIAPHRRDKKMVVSNTTGKKALTRFKRLEKLGRWDLWQAESEYLRLHQIRLHAKEVGLRIVGEDVYCREPEVWLSKIKPGKFSKREEETPLYEGLCLHLGSVTWGEVVIESELPKRFNVMLKKIREYGV